MTGTGQSPKGAVFFGAIGSQPLLPMRPGQPPRMSHDYNLSAVRRCGESHPAA
jgi:hypothetical protein